MAKIEIRVILEIDDSLENPSAMEIIEEIKSNLMFEWADFGITDVQVEQVINK